VFIFQFPATNGMRAMCGLLEESSMKLSDKLIRRLDFRRSRRPVSSIQLKQRSPAV
jgi:hypothetical protein